MIEAGRKSVAMRQVPPDVYLHAAMCSVRMWIAAQRLFSSSAFLLTHGADCGCARGVAAHTVCEELCWCPKQEKPPSCTPLRR